MAAEIYTLDFETYFDKDYTLTKMTTEGYVRDPRFEAMCLVIRYPTGFVDRLPPDKIKEALAALDWDKIAIVAHHAQFDGLILSHHYGHRPLLWFDTMSMARAIVGSKVSVSLQALATHYRLGDKTIKYDHKGKHWHQLTLTEKQDLLDGCARDVELTFKVFGALYKVFPPVEYPLIDATVRMFTEPKLIGDVSLLADIWKEEAQRKENMLAGLEVTKEQLQSANKFVALLEAEGIDVPYKLTEAGQTPCIAKSDLFMQQLLEDEDQRVQALAAARLDIKSTIVQTRAARIGFMAARGPLCIYLNYFGANNTSRWSGGDKTNFQNLNRKGRLRHAIKSPPGKKMAIIDKSQIECRILNTLAGQWDVIERFRNGEDPYANVASQFYGRTITKDDKFERGMGKQSELMCGYGAAAKRFKAVARQGNYGPPVNLTIEEAERFVALYRRSHPAVENLWRVADRVLQALFCRAEMPWGPVYVSHGWVILPGNIPLRYELEYDGNELVRATRFGREKIYGAKLTENIVQALARVAYGEAVARVIAKYGQYPVLSSHDEAVYLLDDGPDLQVQAKVLLQEFKRQLPWLSACPVDAELIISERYEK